MTVKSRPVSRALPYPALEAGNSSFPKGRYEPEITEGRDGRSVEIHHKIFGAPFIEKLIEEGKVGFYCGFSVPKAGVRKLHETGRKGKIEWEDSIIGEPPKLQPAVIYTGEDMKHTLTEQCGVAESWQGKTITLQKGARLARGRVPKANASRCPSMTYRELESGKYTALRKNLIKEKGSDFQKEFLTVLMDSNDFIKWIEDRVGIEESGKDIDVFSVKFAEDEFKEPSRQMERELFKKWESTITPAQACRSSFWGYVTLRHIKENKIESHYLAANNGSLVEGIERIDKALKSGKADAMDMTVRTAIRRLSGLHERGNRSVYVNCPFARAWWRCHIAQEVCKEIDAANQNNVIEVLRESQEYWEALINSVVSKNSVFGDTKIRSALIWTLSEKTNGTKSDLFNAKTLTAIIKKIGVRLAFQELAVFPADELKQLFEDQFVS